MKALRTLPLILAALLGGCAGRSAAVVTPPDVSTAPAAETARAEVAAPARVESHDSGTVTVTFRPPEGTVFTAGYPVELAVERPVGDSVAETIYGVRDVTVRDEEAVVFSIRIAPTLRGRTNYTASFRHSICFPGRCQISTTSVGWTVDVE